MQLETRDMARLWDMLVWSREVRESMSGITYHDYDLNKQLRLATERRLEIIGEAARHVSEKAQLELQQIPWKAIIGMRNILAHEYGDVRNERVYKTASEEMNSVIVILEKSVTEPPK